ncbi:MAG: hypothetical protein HYV42_01455 [Candidatus Magasanikbacteria bacterium]|nr:hypothetical protein [Candidatus Magasanikbacteria bacterium]
MPKKKPIKSLRFRQSLFWDVDPKTIDPKKHARYIIERIMDLGNDDEIRWMWQTYPRQKLKDVALRSRVVHNKSKSLWQLMLGVQ